MDPGRIALLCVVVFATSVMGAITGGNSLVNVPLMILCGFQPRAAIATNMFAVTFMTLAATVRFQRAGLAFGRHALPLCAITLVTALAGAQLTVTLPERAIQAIIAASMVALMVFMIARPGLGDRARETTPVRRAVGYLLATLIGVYGGMFSGGYTTLLTFVCVATLGLPLLDAVGLTKLVNLVSCAAATVVFLRGGLVDLRTAAPLAVFMLAGGWVGAHLAVRRGTAFVRVVFLVVVAGLAIKLLVWDILGAASV